MENKIYLNDLILLETFGNNIKLIRHYDSRIILNENLGGFRELVKFGLLDEYQSYQSKDVFKCEYIISFYGEENSNAVFYGVFRVKSVRQNAPMPSKNFTKYWDKMEINEQTYFYDLEELQDYKRFKNRIVIKWGIGSSTRSWHQWNLTEKKKEVIELRPINYIGEFPGYKNVILNYQDLKTMIENPDSNRNWVDELSRISAVYSILDKKTGNVYIGSASGETGGLWGRWSTYAKDPTGGGNKFLSALKNSDEQFALSFQYSILEVLPKGTLRKEVIILEQLYKKKLGPKICELNAN